ncbi:MAG: HAD hydrolase-like protein, partial [Planctomycetota bacterium]
MTDASAFTPPPFNPPARRLKAVAFDLDGLMVNSEDVYARVGTETLARRGKGFDAELREAMMGRPAADALRVMIDWHQLDDTVEELSREGVELFWHFAEELLRPMPGLAELLAWLDEARVPYGVATSGTRDYAERILRSIDAFDGLRFLITAEDVANGKPAPDPYL